jgi:hypothetical protein
MGETVAVPLSNLPHPFQRREMNETTFCILRKGILRMRLRLHEIVEAGDSVISFDTYLADEVLSSDKESECCWVAASGRNWELQNFLANLAHFLLGRGPWPACQI